MSNSYITLRYMTALAFCICGLYSLYLGNNSTAKILMFIGLIGIASTAYIQKIHRKKELR